MLLVKSVDFVVNLHLVSNVVGDNRVSLLDNH